VLKNKLFEVILSINKGKKWICFFSLKGYYFIFPSKYNIHPSLPSMAAILLGFEERRLFF
jgi:hypothetical protein